jgi:hypothetical protein
MNKKWVEAKTKEVNDKIVAVDAEIYSALKSCKLLDEDDIQIIIDDANEHIGFGLSSLLGHVPFKLWDKIKCKYEDKDVLFTIYDQLEELIKTLPFKKKAEISYKHYERYLDSNPVEFDGDIIITDPCYIMRERDNSSRPKWEDYMSLTDYAGMSKEELEKSGYFKDYDRLKEAEKKWEEEHPDDWNVCEYGDRMDKLGFTKYMTRDTLYGDWSCTTFDLSTKQSIGSFCADAGLVSVFLLDDILKYNPDYKDHLDNSWCATWIKNFKGTVQFVVKEVVGVYEDDTKWWKKGDTWIEYQVEVIGHGINKTTGEPIDFIGTQTGF